MTTTEFNKEQIEQTIKTYCEVRTNPDIKYKLWYEYNISNYEITLIECRPYFKDPSQIIRATFAQIAFTGSEWLIYWYRAKDSWDYYAVEKKLEHLENALAVIDEDGSAKTQGHILEIKKMSVLLPLSLELSGRF